MTDGRNEPHWAELNRLPSANRGPWFDHWSRWRVQNAANWMDAKQGRELVSEVSAFLRSTTDANEAAQVERFRAGDPGE